MKKLLVLRAIYDFGGIGMLIHKVFDKIFKTDKFRNDVYRVSKDADEDEYPRLLEDIFMFETGEKLNLLAPKSFNEKIQWLKLNDNIPIKTTLSDKYAVREWVEKRIGSSYLIPLLGVWDRYDDINFESLPKSFVLKCNHGSGYNVIVKDKATMDHDAIRADFSVWMSTNDAFLFGFELQYKDIHRRIVAESYIEQLDGDLYDYKIHVFNGEPKIIQVIGTRDIEKHTARQIFLNTDWEQVDPMYLTYKAFDKKPIKPENLEELLWVAKKLGKDFLYVRVDLYDVSGKILFGEMTFTPFSGMGKWISTERNNIVGGWIPIGGGSFK